MQRSEFSGSSVHQIATLNVFTLEIDEMGCTVVDHCFYGHTVGVSSGKLNAKSPSDSAVRKYLLVFIVSVMALTQI